MNPITFQEITLNVIESNEYTFLMSSRDVAAGYDVTESIIRSHRQRHSDELIEDKHFIMTRTANNAAKTMWTLEGVHMLGFFIKSERAKEFRKWTAKLLTEIRNGNATISHGNNELEKIILQQNEQIAQLTRELENKPKKLGAYSINDGSWRELSALIAVAAEAMDEADKMSAILSQRANFLMSVLDGFTERMCNEELFSQSRRSSPYLNAYLPYRSPKRHDYFHKKSKTS